MKVMKVLKVIFFVLCVLAFLWVAGSYIEIISHNSAPWREGYAEYSPHNFFFLVFDR